MRTKHAVAADPDMDSISSQLESLIGSQGALTDSDLDGIPDEMELYGNDGFSFAEYGSITRRDGYVEVDYMAGFDPYATLDSDMEGIFAQDSHDGAKLHVFVDDEVAAHKVITYGTCPQGQDCINFYTLKSASFSTANPERRPYFHYVVYADRYNDQYSTVSGAAEMPGNDVIVSLGGWPRTEAQQRGTSVHEFGHNLNLGHNGNDDPNPAKQSIIHESVMNYRYQMSGIPGSNRHTYSAGPFSYESCYTSPKASCETCRNANWCNIAHCVVCDYDYDEWASVDFEGGTPGWENGVGRASGVSHSEQWEKLDAPHWAGAVHQESAEHRANRVRAWRRQLEARGLAEGKDFVQSADGLHLYSVCR